MRIVINLQFGGDCEAAFEEYARILGGEIISLMRFAGSPMEADVAEDWRDKVMIAELRAGDTVLMGSDSPPGWHRPPQGYSITLIVQEPAEAERLWAALSEGGEIGIPLAETFWSPRFGMCADRFGTRWMINCEPKEATT